MSAHEVRSNDAASNAGVARIDMKLEVVILPVSDVDRAKEFYERIGWRLNADRSPSEDFRLVQFTPPGSCCSVHFGKNVTSAAPGSAKAFLVVPDIEAARDERLRRGVAISESSHDAGGVFHHAGVQGRLSDPNPQRKSYASYASFNDPDGNGWLIQEVTARLTGPTEAGDTSFTNELANWVRRAVADKRRDDGAGARD